MEQDITNIKHAVSSDEIIPGDRQEMTKEIGEGMQKSIMQQDQQPQEQQEISAPAPGAPQEYQPQYQEQYAPQEYQPQYQEQQGYSQYQSYSSDTITDIAEQIVLEKTLPLKTEMEKVTNFKNTVETRIEFIDERLKKIEKIIDRLQLSIIQKIGDYAQNIDDIKREVIETQKSFKTISEKNHHK